MSVKTYTLEVLDKYKEDYETSVYKNLSKEAIEDMIAGLYNMRKSNSIAGFNVVDSKGNEVRYSIKIVAEIEDEVRYPIPLPVDYTVCSVKPMTEGNNKGGGQNPPPKGRKPNNPPPGRNPRK
jgi:hypothetical protein